MIKRLIFDVDNTLIPWRDEDYITFEKVLDAINYEYDAVFIKNIITAIENYENDYQIYNRQYMQEAMEKYTGITLPNNFVDLWLEELSKHCEEANPEMLETLAYLSSKYDLVVLTNWFAYSQIKRLEKAGLLKFFSQTYCADNFLIKPYKESYLTAAGEYEPSECMMIGDSIKSDMDGAAAVGMDTIYYNYNHKPNPNGYKEISEFKQLKKLL